MTFGRNRRIAPGFNLTPLMDILFIVLIFLVLTTTFKDATTFEVQLPTAQSSATEPRDLPGLISISVAEDGAIELAGERMALAELQRRLGAVSDPERVTVRLRADADASHGIVVGVMDAVRQSGISQLSIETRPVSPERR